MSGLTVELKTQLEAQQADLTQKIRNFENDLLSLKEAYLKVAGALEILEVIQNKEDEEMREALTATGLAD
jgi:hypothetical protein